MIIVLGPDHTGKTTLAKKFDLPYYHFTKDSNYIDYLKPLCELELFNAVLDRHAICEYSYATVMQRKFKFTMKEWHNLILLTLIQNPLVILCTHKPAPTLYSADQYLPYEKWDQCLRLYRYFLNTHHIPHIEYDYTTQLRPETLAIVEARHKDSMLWWKPMWEAGYGCIGSPNPKVLLVAERIGPNNVNSIPFETGPTGRMLTDMLAGTGTPLGEVAISNLVKSFRRDTRLPNQDDMDLLREEIINLKPKKIVFMGSIARQGARVANELGVEHTGIVHLGYYNYKRITDMGSYHAEWKKIVGIK